MIVFAREDLAAMREAMALVQDHHEEVDLYQDKVKMIPHWEAYEGMEKYGNLIIFTMRDEGELIGYSVFHLIQHLHYAETVFAANDVVYIKPEVRGKKTFEFFKWCEAYMSEYAQVITYNFKEQHPHDELVEALEMDKYEIVYSKYIGA